MRKARATQPKSEPTTPPPQSATEAAPVVSDHAPTPAVPSSSQPVAAATTTPVVPKKEIVLSTCKSAATNILPVAIVSYDKGCQTDDLAEETENRDTPSPPLMVEHMAPIHTPVHFAEAVTPIAVPKKAAVVDEVNLNKFLGTASLWVERALEQSAAFDILKDFSRTDEGTQGLESKVFDPLLSYDDDHVKDRPVMDIHWSPHMSELFLVSYGAKIATRAAPAVKEEATTGLLYVWSKDLHSRPEFKFVTSSSVLCATFHTVEQHLIIGGCYNGQVVIWDMRIPKENPVQRSSISGRGHKHPICAVSTSSVGSANELLTVSTDGMLCQWDTSRLSEPVAVFTLSLPSPTHSSLPSLDDHSASSSSLLLQSSTSSSGISTLNLSALSFGRTDAAHFALVGCGDGQLAKFNLQDRSVSLQQVGFFALYM